MTIIKRIFERFVYGAGFGFGMCIPYKLIGRNENIPQKPLAVPINRYIEKGWVANNDP